MKKKPFVFLLIIACIVFMFSKCHSSKSEEEVVEESIEETQVEIDLGEYSNYDITTSPIGLGEYELMFNSYSAELYIYVKKNSEELSTSLINLEWELINTDDNVVGKAVSSNSSVLKYGDLKCISTEFSITDLNITYNQHVISKIRLSAINEEDGTHQSLIDDFSRQTNLLQGYIDSGDSSSFYSNLKKVRGIYTENEFPSQSHTLDSLELKASEEFNKKTETQTSSSASTTLGNTAATQSANKTTSSNTITAKVETEDEYIKSCTWVSCDDLLRNPSTYSGKHVAFVGAVTQTITIEKSTVQSILESVGMAQTNDTEAVVVSPTSNSENRVILLYSPKSNDGTRLIEDDWVTVYGTFSGLREVTTIIGQTLSIPVITVKYVTYG